MTKAGLVVSVLSLVVAIVTFIVCRVPKGLRRVLHLHLSITLLLAHGTFLLGIESTHNAVRGGGLHEGLHEAGGRGGGGGGSCEKAWGGFGGLEWVFGEGVGLGKDVGGFARGWRGRERLQWLLCKGVQKCARAGGHQSGAETERGHFEWS